LRSEACSEAVVLSPKAASPSRCGAFQDIPGRVDVAADLDLAMRASFGYGPTALLGPCGRIARRSTVCLVKAVIVFTFSSSTAMPPKRAAIAAVSLMQMDLATVGELATLPRQMRHGFQPTARSSLELALRRH
jgi:hypothetical protein